VQNYPFFTDLRKKTE